MLTLFRDKKEIQASILPVYKWILDNKVPNDANSGDVTRITKQELTMWLIQVHYYLCIDHMYQHISCNINISFILYMIVSG